MDCETTGLEPESCEIIEIAGVKFDLEEDGKPRWISQYTSLVNIDGSIPKRASEINHIYDAMLVGQPKAREAIGGFFRWAGLSSILLAHYASFDVSFLGNAVHKEGLMLPRNPTFCTKRISCRLFPELRHRLADLEMSLLCGKDSEWLKERDPQGAHRALYDSTLLMHVFAAMMRRKVPKEDWLDPKRAIKALTALSGESAKFDKPLNSFDMKHDFLTWEAQCKA